MIIFGVGGGVVGASLTSTQDLLTRPRSGPQDLLLRLGPMLSASVCFLMYRIPRKCAPVCPDTRLENEIVYGSEEQL